jgi:hypothetical protein
MNQTKTFAAVVTLFVATASVAGAQHQESIYHGRLSSPIKAPVQTVMRTYEDAHVTAIYERLPRWVHKKLALVDFNSSIVLVVAGSGRADIIEEWIRNSGDTVTERLASREKVLYAPFEVGQGGRVDHVHLVRLTRHAAIGADGYRGFRVAFEPVQATASVLTGVLRQIGPGHGPIAGALEEPRGREWYLTNVSAVLLKELGIAEGAGKPANVHGRVLEHDNRRRLQAERIELLDGNRRVMRTIERGVFEGVLQGYRFLDRGDRRRIELVLEPVLHDLAPLERQRVQVRGWSIGASEHPGHENEDIVVIDAIRGVAGAAEARGLADMIDPTDR